jgi:hypothetical protein
MQKNLGTMVLVGALILCASFGWAQEFAHPDASEAPPPPANFPAPPEYNAADIRPFGSYGSNHHLVHAPTIAGKSVVDQLLEATGMSCCDGGQGGECRPTRIIQNYAWLEGKWCAINPHSIRMDIAFPDGVFAVVCAAQVLDIHGCPVSTHCAAGATEG